MPRRGQYDDKEYCQLDSDDDVGDGRFDMIHAIVCDPFGGSQSISRVTFRSLAACTSTPCEAFLDLVEDSTSVTGTLHYNHIGFGDDGEVTTVWAALTGTQSDIGFDSDKSCIYGIWVQL